MSDVTASGPKQDPGAASRVEPSPAPPPPPTPPAAAPSRRPSYAPVIDWIYGQITSGQVPVGSRLPSIVDIAAACGVGVKTARSAVEHLAARGTVRTRQGSGTVVLSTPRGLSDSYVGSSSGRRIVGTLVPNLTYYGETLSGIESVLAERDGRMMLTCSHYDHSTECDQLESLVSDGAEGILCSASLAHWPENDSSFDRLRKLPVPCVLVDRRLPEGMLPRLPAVLTDLEQAAYLGTDHLARVERRRIAGVFMAGRHGERELRSGYRAALAAHGIRVDPALELAVPDFDAAQTAERLIDCGADAAFIGGGRLAGAVLAELLQRRRRVPRDIALAAYDAQGGDVAEVPMTSVTPQRAAIGRLATTMLLDLLANPRTATTGEFRVHPTLIIRRSTVATAS